MNTYCYDKSSSSSISSPNRMDLTFGTEIKPVIGGGTSDYNGLSNKPSINGVELVGNKTNEDILIGVITNEEIDAILKNL